MWVLTYRGEPCWIRWGVIDWPEHFRKCLGIYRSERQAAAKAKRLNIDLETSAFACKRVNLRQGMNGTVDIHHD
jgi:hypothetical protein